MARDRLRRAGHLVHRRWLITIHARADRMAARGLCRSRSDSSPVKPQSSRDRVGSLAELRADDGHHVVGEASGWAREAHCRDDASRPVPDRDGEAADASLTFLVVDRAFEFANSPKFGEEVIGRRQSSRCESLERCVLEQPRQDGIARPCRQDLADTGAMQRDARAESREEADASIALDLLDVYGLLPVKDSEVDSLVEHANESAHLRQGEIGEGGLHDERRADLKGSDSHPIYPGLWGARHVATGPKRLEEAEYSAGRQPDPVSNVQLKAGRLTEGLEQSKAAIEGAYTRRWFAARRTPSPARP